MVFRESERRVLAARHSVPADQTLNKLWMVQQTITAAGYARLASIWKTGTGSVGSYIENKLAAKFLLMQYFKSTSASDNHGENCDMTNRKEMIEILRIAQLGIWSRPPCLLPSRIRISCSPIASVNETDFGGFQYLLLGIIDHGSVDRNWSLYDWVIGCEGRSRKEPNEMWEMPVSIQGIIFINFPLLELTPWSDMNPFVNPSKSNANSFEELSVSITGSRKTLVNGSKCLPDQLLWMCTT